jgi:glycosyltransferase involved in cell wall biosynthesis
MKDVLYIGPDYRGHRGGMGAVLDTYSANIKPFKFIPSYSNTSAVKRQIVFIKAVFALSRMLIRDRDIRIVHIHAAQKGSFMRKSVLLLISQLFGRKVVLHIHGSMFDLFYKNAAILRPYIRFVFRRADAVVSLSDKWNEYFATNFKIKKLLILKNIIDRPIIKPAISSQDGPVKLLFLGLIGQRKGLFDLLKVLETNSNIFDDGLSLTIGGNGEVDRLKKTIENNHTSGNVQFAGWVTGELKKELLSNCDIYVLPSYNEGLPISILEAMAYGKAVISTTIGGIPEIVIPGKNGWLFDPGDLNALTTILKEVISNKKLLEQYGNYSYQLSESYTPQVVMGSLRELYDQMLHA